jgi:SWI/SNF-related matrix-associated actin-dependent regulator 1 of chromatin subfamily A
MQILEQPTEFHVRIDYNRFRVHNTNQIKKLDGVKFDFIRKLWIVPYALRAQLEQVQKDCRAEWIIVDKSPQDIGQVQDMPDLEFDIPLKTGQMRPYQLQGVARGIELRRYINGDEQGLGKTVQSIATIHGANLIGESTFPCLVICPSSTKINWQREWEQWTGRKAMILDDRVKANWHRFHELGMNDIFICNYESLKKFFVDYMPPKGKMKTSADIRMNPRIGLFKSVIMDESHRCKDSSTQQAKIALQICKGKEWVILLSGTPVVNKPVDLFPQLAIMNRLQDFGGKKNFFERYCEGGRGASNLKELNYLMNKNCFFRREKKDVAKDLPEKQRQTILCDITTRAEYNKAKHDFTSYLENNGFTAAEISQKMKGEILIKMTELKRISALGKLNEVREFVDEVIASGEKLIVFCSLHAIVDEMLKFYPDAVTVTGRDSMDAKQKNIDKFQNDPNCKLIVCNIKAAGVGITLTASSRVAFIEYPWTYADCAQCEDRAHRIGQKNNVMCTYFLGHNTIDEDLYQLIQEKRHTANSITGATDKMEMSFIDNVLNIFKK